MAAGVGTSISQPGIELSDVKFAYDQIQKNGANHGHVLDDFSLSIAKAGFISILGPSGCGKTTILRLIAGLMRPQAGSIYADGVEVTRPDPSRTVIFQEYGLFEWKTVLSNIEFGLMARGLKRPETVEAAREFIRLVRLDGAENKYPHELSGGMRQRAAIARALIVDPSCLLMDEPFAALDAPARLHLQKEVATICCETRKTVVLVTHNIEEAVFLSDRVLVLSRMPSQIIGDLTIDLPRPRTEKVRSSDAYRESAAQIWKWLDDLDSL